MATRKTVKAVSDLFKDDEPAETLEDSRIVFDARNKQRVCQRKLADALARLQVAEEQLQLWEQIGESEPALQFWRQHRGRHRGVTTTAVACVNDWHAEERVDPATVNGRNSVDLEEIAKRAQRYFQHVVRLIDLSSGLAKVGDIVLAILGDLISGYIHEELEESNQLSPTEAILFVQDLLCNGIEHLKRETKLPILIPTCVGNHGRTTKKPRISTAYKNNYEWLLYHQMARYFRNDPRVHWVIGKAYHNIVEIRRHRVRFHHGNAIQYWGGVGGIAIPVNKAIAQWNKSEAAHLDIFGHFHQYLPHYPNWICSGTLLGWNPFAIQIKAEYQRPTQAFVVIDEQQGPTVSIPVFCNAVV